MFERYTEKARRVIFFARYEASQFGSPFIETEHLFLGLLREDKLLGKLLNIEDPSELRQEIEAHLSKLPSSSTSVDLPLSNPSKRVLKQAAEEADRLKDRHIGTEHLLLGLLREDCFLVGILRQHGVVYEALLQKLSQPLSPGVPFISTTLPRAPRTSTILIHEGQWDAEYIHDRVKSCTEIFWHWQQEAWKARDIAVDRSRGQITFDLTLADNSQDYEVVKAGWKKDRCAVCRWELYESDDLSHGAGYTNGRDWLCSECYEKFWGDPHFFTSNYPEIT